MVQITYALLIEPSTLDVSVGRQQSAGGKLNYRMEVEKGNSTLTHHLTR